MRRVTKLAKITHRVASEGKTMAGLIGGLIHREEQHMAMIDLLNDRGEVFSKLISLNARITGELATMLERPDLTEEIIRTVDMAGAVIDQMGDEFKEKM